jgi:hypothetical protein
MTIGISNQTIAQDIYINTNTTWSTNQNPTGNVIISDGITLTVADNVTITMSQNKKIILEKNSNFNASDITITGSQWGGFNFDNTGIGTADRAGCVVISNSSISGAHLVFNAISGGGIRSSYNVFQNNEKILNAYYHICRL